jgi:putative acetyltransferase
MAIYTRPEEPADIPAIRRVNLAAFETSAEADLVDKLRQKYPKRLISRVALLGDDIVGHILFSPVTVTSESGEWGAIGLGPLAVMPAHQKQGVGSALVDSGLAECWLAGHFVVIVLGHADYYPRFGFVPTQPLGIRWEKDVPPEVFMLREMKPDALAGRTGVVRYLPEFDGV